MLGIIAKGIRTWFFLLLVVTVWCSTALAVEMLPGDGERGKTVTLYSNLGQNIEEQAKLYSEYSDYREHLRLKIFWEEIERLNLVRDEIILTIGFLERSLEKQTPERFYATTGSLPITSGPEHLSNFFSNWRSFYLFISGGFFLIISSLLVVALCITCKRNVIPFLMNSFKKLVSDGIDSMTKMASYDCCDYDILHKGDGEYRKAA